MPRIVVRRRVTPLLVLSLVLVAIGGPPRAGATAEAWQLVGPRNRPAVATAIDPADTTRIFVGSNNGSVFRSLDGGATWDDLRIGVANATTQALLIDPLASEVILAGTNTGGVRRSADGGETWTQTTPLLGNISGLSADAADPRVLYAGVVGGGVRRSVDGGQTWEDVNAGLMINLTVLSLVASPVRGGAVYVGTFGNGVFASLDAGGGWSASTRGMTAPVVRALALAPGEPEVIYAGTGAGVFRSTDGGITWQGINSGLTFPFIQSLAVDPTNPRVIYAGTAGGGVFRTTDAGASWSPLTTGLPAEATIFALRFAATDPPTLYAGAANGLYRLAP